MTHRILPDIGGLIIIGHDLNQAKIISKAGDMAMTDGQAIQQRDGVHWRTFLKDVLICSLGAYGGPEAHYGV